MKLFDSLLRFFEEDLDVVTGDRVLVAFSGGLDSTALLWGLHELSSRLGIELEAAHLDHGLDPGSADRAAAAAEAAARLGVRCHVERREVGRSGRGHHGLEAAARRERYRYLEDQRERVGARWIATAHHRDDQAETVLLRMLFGSGLDGLAAIQLRRGHLIRPLLWVPRTELRTALACSPLGWVEDPTNRNPAMARNRVRHALLPRLRSESPDLDKRLAGLAANTLALRQALDARLLRHLEPRPAQDSVTIRRKDLVALPHSLRLYALRLLGRQAGIAYPPTKGAQLELLRQLDSGGEIGCDCGRGWRWRSTRNDLRLVRTRPRTPDFTYTVNVPGSVELEELALRIRVSFSRVSPWMFRSSPNRAGLALPIQPGDQVTIRNRRAGDRIQPLGWERDCRVKQLLINRHVPREQRDRLPFLCYEGAIAWIPGVAVSEHFRLSSNRDAFVVEIEPQ